MIDLLHCQVDVTCPSCGYIFEILLRQAAAEETVICPGCRQEIHLVDEDGSTARAERELREALQDLSRIGIKFR